MPDPLFDRLLRKPALRIPPRDGCCTVHEQDYVGRCLHDVLGSPYNNYALTFTNDEDANTITWGIAWGAPMWMSPFCRCFNLCDTCCESGSAFWIELVRRITALHNQYRQRAYLPAAISVPGIRDLIRMYIPDGQVAPPRCPDCKYGDQD